MQEGFFTEEIRIMGRRMGFRVVTLDGEEGILAHVDCNSNYKVVSIGWMLILLIELPFPP